MMLPSGENQRDFMVSYSIGSQTVYETKKTGPITIVCNIKWKFEGPLQATDTAKD